LMQRLVEQSIEKDKVIKKLLHGDSESGSVQYCTPRTPDKRAFVPAEVEHFNFNSSFEVE